MLKEKNIDVVFLDIEMPYMNGLEAADIINKKYSGINIVFVTGYPEYSLAAYKIFPSNYLVKPVFEEDIRSTLKNLRYPLSNIRIEVQCKPYALYVDNRPFALGSAKAEELFAYLIYRKGCYCSNNELYGILWDGNIKNESRLRQLTMEIRNSLEEIKAADMLVKKYGRIGIDMNYIKINGDIELIKEYFEWETEKTEKF